ncbi:hypothetical protein [Streptomyces sp. NBC_01262]|uniref:hypothetical protein n=1 Tax=Streptomyces sp. NBC_01262 TaxID=2903803 RepID=UPI002E3161E4|nr:hypothetical protein [Streptomyces sp. NBC_01262]
MGPAAVPETTRPQDVQVLSPRKKNIAGMTALTADKPRHYHGGTSFRLGDRVQQIRNTPHRGEAGVFNGTSGAITALNSEAHQLTFTDGERQVRRVQGSGGGVDRHLGFQGAWPGPRRVEQGT